MWGEPQLTGSAESWPGEHAVARLLDVWRARAFGVMPPEATNAVLHRVAAALKDVGTWQLASYSQEFLDTKETTRPFGDHPTGYIQYSPGGHMIVFLTAGELRPPVTAAYSDAERAQVHR
jgi:hypothetical protein